MSDLPAGDGNNWASTSNTFSIYTPTKSEQTILTYAGGGKVMAEYHPANGVVIHWAAVEEFASFVEPSDLVNVLAHMLIEARRHGRQETIESAASKPVE